MLIKLTSSPDVDQQIEAVRGRNVANKDKVTFTSQTTNEPVKHVPHDAMSLKPHIFSFIFLARSQNSSGKRKEQINKFT